MPKHTRDVSKEMQESLFSTFSFFPAWLARTFGALGNVCLPMFWSLSSWGQLHPFEVHAEWEGDGA